MSSLKDPLFSLSPKDPLFQGLCCTYPSLCRPNWRSPGHRAKRTCSAISQSIITPYFVVFLFQMSRILVYIVSEQKKKTFKKRVMWNAHGLLEDNKEVILSSERQLPIRRNSFVYCTSYSIKNTANATYINFDKKSKVNLILNTSIIYVFLKRANIFLNFGHNAQLMDVSQFISPGKAPDLVREHWRTRSGSFVLD